MKKFLIALSLLSITTLANANPLAPFEKQQGQIDIAGGTAHIPVMKQAAQEIMEFNPDIRITITGGGSGVGVQKVGEGLVQIGNTGRPLKANEIEKYGLVSFPFAIDGVAITVNPENPISNLTQEQLIDIFSGKVTNWKEVGGQDAIISLYAREDGSGTRDTFEELALKKTPTVISANIVNSNGAMKTAIQQDPNAIGYISIGHLNDNIKGVALDGVAPTQENTLNGEYIVSRSLFMNTKGEPEGIVKSFIDYIYSDRGQEIITDVGFLPINPKK